MSVSSTTNRKQVTLTAPAQAISTGIYVIDEEHVLVQRTRSGVVSTLVLDTDYEVTGVQDGAGCTITTIAQEVGDVLTISRSVPITQTTDYVANSKFSSANTERNLDKLTVIAQDQDEKLSRAIRLPATATDAQIAGAEIDPDTTDGYVLTAGAGGAGIPGWSAAPTFGGAELKYSSKAAMSAATGLTVGARAVVLGEAEPFELTAGVNPEAGNAIQGVGIDSAISGYYWKRKFSGKEVNAKWFGAVGDFHWPYWRNQTYEVISGETDDTAAIQAAVTYAENHQLDVFIPAGHYRITGTIENSLRPIRIYGARQVSHIGDGHDDTTLNLKGTLLLRHIDSATPSLSDYFPVIRQHGAMNAEEWESMAIGGVSGPTYGFMHMKYPGISDITIIDARSGSDYTIPNYDGVTHIAPGIASESVQYAKYERIRFLTAGCAIELKWADDSYIRNCYFDGCGIGYNTSRDYANSTGAIVWHRTKTGEWQTTITAWIEDNIFENTYIQDWVIGGDDTSQNDPCPDEASNFASFFIRNNMYKIGFDEYYRTRRASFKAMSSQDSYIEVGGPMKCNKLHTATFDNTGNTFTFGQSLPLISDGDVVTLQLADGATIPTGLSEQSYYVISYNSSTYTGQLSLTSGGSAVTFSDNGAGTINVKVPSDCVYYLDNSKGFDLRLKYFDLREDSISTLQNVIYYDSPVSPLPNTVFFDRVIVPDTLVGDFVGTSDESLVDIYDDLALDGIYSTRVPSTISPSRTKTIFRANRKIVSFGGSTPAIWCKPNSNLNIGTGDFTIETYFKTRDAATGGIFRFDSSSAQTGFNGSGVALTSVGGTRLRINGQGITVNTSDRETTSLTEYHLVFVRSGDDFTVYVDGVPFYEYKNTGSTINVTNGSLVLGSYGTDHLIGGGLGLFRIYNWALSRGEAERCYLNPDGKTDVGYGTFATANKCVMDLDFDSIGNCLVDKSGNSLHAYLTDDVTTNNPTSVGRESGVVLSQSAWTGDRGVDILAFTTAIPAGYVIDNIYAYNAGSGSITFDIDSSSGGSSIVSAATVGAGVTAELTVAGPTVPFASGSDLYVSDTGGGWTNVELYLKAAIRKVSVD